MCIHGTQLLTVSISEIFALYKKQPLSEHHNPSPLVFPALFLPSFLPEEEERITKVFLFFKTPFPTCIGNSYHFQPYKIRKNANKFSQKQCYCIQHTLRGKALYKQLPHWDSDITKT